MFQVILITLAGVLIGYLLRRFQPLRFVDVSLHYTTGFMLLVLGLSVGGNPQVVDNIWKLGGQAVLIGGSATLGSAAVACALWHWLFKTKKNER